MKKTIYMLIVVALFFCYSGLVNARTCVYDVDDNATLDPDDKGELAITIYDDDLSKKPYADVTILGEEIRNWGEKIGGFDAKEYYKKTGKCPNHLIYDTEYYNMLPSLYFSDIEHLVSIEEAESNSAAEFAIYNLIRPETDIENANENSDVYMCNYNKYILTVDNIQKNISISGYNAALNVYYSVSDELKNYWFNERDIGGCINELYYCSVKVNTIVKYSIYTDSTQATLGGATPNCTCIALNGQECSGAGECPTFTKHISNISSAYSNYSNCNDNICKNNNLIAANNAIEVLKSACNTMMGYLDYTEPCLQNCLTLNDKIEELKVANGITSGSIVPECGFSDRLLIFIGNIIKWIKYILPVVVIILGILDFIKAIGADKEDEMKKAQHRFIIRLIAAALIFIVPFILEFVLDKMGFAANGCGIIDL